MIRLKEIAEVCGVNVSTVSRALKDDPRVKADTRKKIHTMASRMGYTPNWAAQSLKGGKTNTIWFLIADLFNPLTVTVWLALDDTDEENGAMQFLPGSHKVGHIPWKESSEESVLNQQIEDISVFEKPFSNNLKAGEFSLHSSLLVHGSPKNQSSRRRCGLTIRYAPQEVVPLSSNYSKMSYFVSGNITAPHWQDNSPPTEYFL